MHTSIRTMLRAASMLSGGLVLAACAAAGNDLTGPGGTCPAATLSRSPSRDLVPSGISASAGGCAHRAAIEVPLARVIDLNDRGEVLGVVNATGPAQLAVWSITGTRLLTTPAGAVEVIGTDLNNKGEAVGCAEFPVTPPPPGGDFDRIANAGTFAETGGAWVCHVIFWNAQGVPTDLGTLDPNAREARPLAISDAGVIVGQLSYGIGQKAFVRSVGGTLVFPQVPGTSSAAVAVNEQNQVAGWYTDGAAASGPWHAFLWTQAGGRVDIVPPGSSGAQASLKPLAINESGEVLGTVYAYHPDSPGFVDRVSTFLYASAAGYRDVGAASGFTPAVALNDQGEILGFASVEGVVQPASWATTRPDLLPVRFGWTAGEGQGTVYQINNWNEVLDNYSQAGVNHNVVWTWNPERYR